MANTFTFSKEDLESLGTLYGNDSYDYPLDENCCDGEGDICDLNEGMRFEAMFIPVLYSVAFVVGVLGNGLLLGVLLRSRKTWSVADTFILHLGVADVLLLVTLPLWAAQARQASGWNFGTTLCKITGAVFTVVTAHNSMITVNMQWLIFFTYLWLISFVPPDQFLLRDLPPGLHQSGPLPVHRPRHPDVLPQEPLGRSHQLLGSVALLPVPLHP